MSHWEGFGTLLMATDTSNALLDPVLYGAYTVCLPHALTYSANRLPRSKHANIFARARSEPYHTHSTWSIYVSIVHMSHWGPSRTLLTASDTRVHTLVTPKS